jgi:lycopene beta-cyclase
LQHIRQQPNIDLLFGKVDQVFSTADKTGIIIKDQIIHSRYVFNSILFNKPVLSPKEYWLLQHFKGWIIETERKMFDPGRAVFMDFRTTQKPGTAFCYVLPLTVSKALVEYTLFSPSCLNEEEYNKGLKAYIHDVLQIKNYRILDEEHGVIPMTNFKFPSRKNNIINIGTAGGQTKGSSGYTFNFIQKHCVRLVEELIKGEGLGSSGIKKRFHFYDSVFLNILYHQTLPGDKIFTDLFRKNKPMDVLKFLDNESGLWEELKIVSSLPTFPFVKAALQQIF